MQQTQQQIRVQQLMALIPQLVWTAYEIDSAIEAEDFPLVRRFMNNWRRQAGNVHGILKGADPTRRDLARGLNNSVSLAAIAETAILKDPKPTREDCMKARQAINTVSDSLNIWVGQYSTETDRGGAS
jgi:hypothetical protein